MAEAEPADKGPDKGPAAFKHLSLAEPTRDPAQFGLFGGDEETD